LCHKALSTFMEIYFSAEIWSVITYTKLHIYYFLFLYLTIILYYTIGNFSRALKKMMTNMTKTQGATQTLMVSSLK